MPVHPLARIVDIEKKLERAEKDAELDALEPEIAEVERALRQQIDDEKRLLEAEKSRFVQGHGMFARFFARGEYRQTVGAVEQKLEQALSGEHKLHQLKARFYDDKMRQHAREFIRIASKVQKNVIGDWDEKAIAAAARFLAGSTGDEAIDVAKLYKNASPEVMLQALLGVSVDEKVLRADVVTAASLLVGKPAPPVSAEPSIVAAAIIAGRDIDEAIAVAHEIDAGVVGSDEAKRAIAAAGVMSGRPAGEVIAFAKHVQSQLAGTWESEATVIAAGILGTPGKPARELIRRAFVLPGLARAEED